MPAVFQTDNPLLYTQLDGVIVSEQSPVPSVIAAGANNAIFIAQFERGPKDSPQFVTSISELQKIFGANAAYGGNKALRLKGWSNLYVTRAVAGDAVKATVTQSSGGKDLLKITAKDFGKYGNEIKVSIADGSSGAGSKKITVSLGNRVETYDNLSLAGKTNDELAVIFAGSELVVVTDAHDTDSIENAELTLATGSDGAIAAADYTRAIAAANVNVSGKLFFTDDQSLAVKTALANFIKTERNGQCVLGPISNVASVADAVNEASALLDREGRVLYAYNPIKYLINGNVEEESPVYLAASIMNLLPPHVSPAAARSTKYTQTAVGVRNSLTRAELIQCKTAGIMAFEDDEDLGVKIVSAVTGNPQFSVIRRRMSDFYINSLTRFLKNFQNEPNSALNRSSIRAAIRNFDEGLVFNGILPSDNEVDGGLAFSIRTEGISTPEEEAMGILKIELMRRIFAEARFLVLEATISESVVVEEV